MRSSSGHTWVLGPRFLNEFRFNFAKQIMYQAPSGVPYYKNLDFSPERFTGGTPTYIFPSFTWGNDPVFITGQKIREWRDDFSISAVVAQHQVRRRHPERDAARGRAGQPERHVELRQRSAVRPERALALAARAGQHFHGIVPGPDQVSAAPLLPALRAGRVEGRRRAHAEPRPALRARHLDLERGPEERRVVLSAHPAVREFPEPRRQQQRVAAHRGRVGRARTTARPSCAPATAGSSTRS